MALSNNQGSHRAELLSEADGVIAARARRSRENLLGHSGCQRNNGAISLVLLLKLGLMLTTSPSLLERVRQPEAPEAWERFIKLYTPLLYSWARRSGVQDADDLVQDVFTVLVEQLAQFRYDPARGCFRAWLKTILMNRLRKSLRRPGAQPLFDVAAATDAVHELEQDEHRRLLVARAAELIQTDFQPSTWKSFWECEVNGRPAAEVARELGLNVGAVWVNKSRVLARLRQELAGLWD